MREQQAWGGIGAVSKRGVRLGRLGHLGRLGRVVRLARGLRHAFLLGAFLAAGTGAARAAVDGAQLAKQGMGSVPACSSCHGAQGEGMAAANFPRLAGQGEQYLRDQLEALANGMRPSPVMGPVAKGLSDAQRDAVAKYYAGLPTPLKVDALAATAQEDTDPSERGAWLAKRGDWGHNVPACNQCHGPGGIGVGQQFPSLAGQSEAYLVAQLQAWQQGHRVPGPLALMPAIATRLDDKDIHAVAAYYAKLPAAVAAGKGAAAPAGKAPDAAGSAVPAAAAKAPAPAAGQAAAPRGAAASAPAAAAAAPVASGAPQFTPPPESAIPNNEFGKIVREGESIFMHTPEKAGKFVGNNLNCASCHLDAGRRPNSAPMWAAYVIYPAYRAKNGHVNTLAERLQGCFRFSMNGKAPPPDDAVLTALQTYMFWLASKAPTGVKLAGQGYPKLAAPAQKADYVRGSEVFGQYCATCHGAKGQGQKQGDHWVFPALWGPDSYNWGAGMHQINNAAGFIMDNMPLGQAGMLTVQQAWDVAYFMNAHERPQDPRYAESVAHTRERYHNEANSLYGLEIEGHVLGSDSPASGGRLRQQ